MEVVRLQAALWGDRAIHKAPEDLPRDVHDALIFANANTELDSLSLGVPTGVLGKLKNMVPSSIRGRCLD
jgi:hypothetical protein